MVKEKTKILPGSTEKLTDIKNLVVHNDDFNTFDHVILTLIEVCKHDKEQAEQCTIIIHFKGKCAVKSGDYQKLKPMCEEILRRGITATIE
jgi:ATP-dependent Clp protease adaptor protein ClpS